MRAEDRELERVWSEVTDLRRLSQVIQLEFANLRFRFTLATVVYSALVVVLGGVRLLDYFQAVR